MLSNIHAGYGVYWLVKNIGDNVLVLSVVLSVVCCLVCCLEQQCSYK